MDLNDVYTVLEYSSMAGPLSNVVLASRPTQPFRPLFLRAAALYQHDLRKESFAELGLGFSRLGDPRPLNSKP